LQWSWLKQILWYVAWQIHHVWFTYILSWNCKCIFLVYSISYCNVGSSRLVYYSILNYLGQRSQNISIKYPLINILKMLVLLTKTVYCSQLYGSYDSIKNVVTLIFFSSCFIKIVTFCWVTYTGSSKIYSSIQRGSIFKSFHIYLCPLVLQNYSIILTYLDEVNFSIFISFSNIFFCKVNDQPIFFLWAYEDTI